MKYQQDKRETLDFSQIRSEAWLASELARDQKVRITMKYRIYGREGVTDHEFNKLVEWGIVKRRPGATQSV